MVRLLGALLFLMAAAGSSPAQGIAQSAYGGQPAHSRFLRKSVANRDDLRVEPIRIDILPAGEKRTYQIRLNRPADAVYSLRNNPPWMAVDENTGLITFNAPKHSTEAYSFSVSAKAGRTTVASGAISGVVKTINATLQNDLAHASVRMLVDTGASVGSVRTSSTYMAPNNMRPKTAKENTWDIIQPYFRSYSKNIEVVTIDGGTGRISKMYVDGENWAGLSSVITKEGKLYIVSKKSRNDQQPSINIYDPVANKWTLDAIPVPKSMKGSEYALIQVATDGAVFVASNHIDGSADNYKLRLLEIDSKTNKVVHDSGPIGKPSGVWQLAADDTYVYLLSGKVPWRALQYNRQTHTLKVLAEAKSGLSVEQTAFGVVMFSGGKHYFLYEGRAILADDPKDWRASPPPWPFPKGYTAREKWYTLVNRRNPVKSRLPARPKVITQNATEANGKAELWVKQPADATYKKYEYSVRTYPAHLARLARCDNGKILVGASRYGPYLMYDLASKKTERLPGKLGLSLYTMVAYNGKIYMSGYPMGALYEYDYSKPWTQGIHSWKPGDPKVSYQDQSLNPRWCCKLSDTGSGAHTMVSSAIGADGMLYFGGHWKRNGIGGGLGWYDPQTRKSGGIWKIFSNYQIVSITAVLGGQYIAISTVPVTDIQLKKPKPKSGRLFLFNTATKKIEAFNDPMPEFRYASPGQIIGVDGPYVVGVTNEPGRKKHKSGYIYRVNMLTGTMDYKIEVHNTSFNVYAGRTIVAAPNGRLITWLGWDLVNIDPVSGDIKIISKYGIKSRHHWYGFVGDAVLVDNDLYIANFESLLKLPDVLTAIGG